MESKNTNTNFNFDKFGNILVPEAIKEDKEFNEFAKDFKGNKKHLKIFMRVNNLEVRK